MDQCWRCGYARTPSDQGPDWACPRCGVALNKAAAAINQREQKTKAALSDLPGLRPIPFYKSGPWVKGLSLVGAVLALTVLVDVLRPVSKGKPGSASGLSGLLAVVTAFLLYFLPSIIAFRRHHADRWAILAINFFLGLTLIGWVVALAWSLRGVQTPTKNTSKP